MKVAFETIPDFANRNPLGFIILQTDLTLESDIIKILPQANIEYHISRIANEKKVTKETLALMEQNISHSAALLSPSLGVKSIAYGCTSGATIIGEENVAALVQKPHPNMPVTNPITALIVALKLLNIKNIGLLTPYIAEVSQSMIALLNQNKITVKAFSSFEQSDDHVVASISEQSVKVAILDMDKEHGDKIEAYFASCTNLHSFRVIDEIEKITNKHMFSSNQVLIWHNMRLANYNYQPQKFGKLFSY